MAIESTAYARAGLVGNPSDGFHGKTISVSVRDFHAKVSLYENTDIEIVPSQQDRSRYASVRELIRDIEEQGYYGGVRLMKATIRQFVLYCDEQGIELHDGNFSLRYRSTIPRRVGLAGSSALVTATFNCLMNFYEVDIPKPIRPDLILRVETDELGIAAGLQDRVIQVYENCVFMDFDEKVMKAKGHGNYELIDPALLPPLFLAYREDLAQGSEIVHNDVRERWLRGDAEVVHAMRDFASYAQEARDRIVAGDGDKIGPLLDQNFERRCSVYAISEGNLDMVQRARSVGAHCKFAGSGGAIIGLLRDDHMFEELQEAFAGTGVVALRPRIGPGD
ncbi:MAG: GHMP kinase [Candidatus Hydrogenedentes bacterium]|nr:GHMP kinase [Candidatus Hydrogenedentota bacterium]